MAPLRGSFWVFVLYDVAEEIRIDKLHHLVGAETARPQPSFKHPAPEYVRFERPPAIEYPDPIALESGEQFEARIKYFDYGVASVELKMEFEADWEQLIRLSNRWILAPEIERRTAELIQSRMERAASALVQAYPARLSEDYYIIHLREALDEEGRPLPAGRSGRLAVRGPTGCRYLADSRQTEYVRDGWNITGDRYRLDEDGYFWFEGRSDDMIVSSGYNIAGPEVESALLEHPAVKEAAVIGAPDQERGQIVKAFIVLQPSFEGHAALVRELQEHVKRSVAPYKYPRAIEFVAALPKGPSGKVQRYLLRQREPAAAPDEEAP